MVYICKSITIVIISSMFVTSITKLLKTLCIKCKKTQICLTLLN